MTPEQIWLTHGHIDHAGGAAELAEALSLPIEGPDERDAFLLSDLKKSGERFGIMDARNVTPTRWLVEGETVSIGDLTFNVLHVPGHTPGHLVFVMRSRTLCAGRRHAVPEFRRPHGFRLWQLRAAHHAASRRSSCRLAMT